MDIKETIFQLVLDLIRDVKSRKFLLTVVFGVLVVLNSIYDLGLDTNRIAIVGAVVIAFIVLEGIADIRSR